MHVQGIFACQMPGSSPNALCKEEADERSVCMIWGLETMIFQPMIKVVKKLQVQSRVLIHVLSSE